MIAEDNLSQNEESRPSSSLPTKWQGFLFQLKTRVFQTKRLAQEITSRPEKHGRSSALVDANILAEVKHPLWTELSPAEFPLTAGKVENLRIVAQALDGLEIPAGKVFSFWRQVGRTTKKRGYTTGRELREGCMVPSIGGGLCQMTGLLYQAAKKAGLEIVERHQHSRLVAGSMGERDLDATVYWNYVDLRFRAETDWRLEVRLTASDLVVQIKVADASITAVEEPQPKLVHKAAPSGDCLTCNQVECFRHPAALAKHSAGLGHSSFLLDTRWPEFDLWCAEHAREGDTWMLPLDGTRWKKPNYQWSLPVDAPVHYATSLTLLRSLTQRRLPSQGAVRQAALLASDRKLAVEYAKNISPECRHIVVSQNLLPHLWDLGVLGGRTFDVLMERWPLHELQGRLDRAAQAHPDSPTLGDFRANSELVASEKKALENAGRLVTPHREIAKLFAGKAWLLDWSFPEISKSQTKGSGERKGLFFPASPLARKGVFEVIEALKHTKETLLVLGRASEGGVDPLGQIVWTDASMADLALAKCLVLPAWIEHQPRIALRALAMGIPVIASKECGLSPHQYLTQVDAGDVEAIQRAIEELAVCSGAHKG